ncbi:MAG: alpha/beta hydrolase [Gordonia sp. (in: high G+C Gram-positive bacteria)]
MTPPAPRHRDDAGEVRALAHLGLLELSKATIGVAQVHRAVSATVFGVLKATLGRPSVPVRVLHDAISESVYSTITGVLESAALVADSLPETRRPPTQTAAGAAVIGVLDGLIGDALAAEGSPLAPELAVRVDGAPVPLRPADLARAYPAATDHVVVFLHGLMETEHSWGNPGRRPTYGSRLAADIGATEVAIRYNTGKTIAENGRTLARALTALTMQWPVPVRRLTLIGHSMGGLVIRSACHTGALDHAPWVPLVGETVSLGSPHLGAPLARGVHVASAVLRVLTVTRPFGELLRRRSAGVRDLFHGTIVPDGVPLRDPDGPWQGRGIDVDLLASARHLFVTATITRNPDHPVGLIVGDGLVLTPSGRGFNRSRHLGFRAEDGMHLGGANHFTLLNNDVIYAWMLDALRPRRALPASRPHP